MEDLKKNIEVVILAGGRGTRLQSVVKDLPKPMAPIKGKAFLEILLDKYLSSGFNKIYLSVGYKSEIIKNHFGASYKNCEIDYITEEKAKGTGGAIRLACEKIDAKYLLVANGDTFIDYNIDEMLRLFRKIKSKIMILVRRSDEISRYGSIAIDGNKVKSFKEKTTDSQSGFISCGVYLIDCEYFLASSEKDNFSVEIDYFEKEVANGTINCLKTEGFMIDIGIPESYSDAQKDLKSWL